MNDKGGLIMNANLTIRILDWLDRIFAWPILLYRRLKFGYTYRRIYLGEGEFTIVDQRDYYRLKNFKWYLQGNRTNLYAARNFKVGPAQTKKIYLHREIINAPRGLLVDHKNCNSLDNRGANLRPATVSQNACNSRRNKSNASSKFRGVSLEKRVNKWVAVICHHRKRFHLGTFVSEIDAAKAYDEAAKKYHGEFARLNFPQDATVSNSEIRTERNTIKNPKPCLTRTNPLYYQRLYGQGDAESRETTMEQGQPELVSSKKAAQRDVEPLRFTGTLSIGIDIGSTSSDIVALDGENRIVLSDYQRTKGKPIETLREQLHRIYERINPARVEAIAATGSAARLPAKMLAIPFANEVAAQAAAISLLYPDLENATVIEMGGQDSKLIFLQNQSGAGRIRDFALNTVCAAGTGSFLDQQADRLGINIEDQFARLALQSKSVPRMAGRCSVFAKSDMIHLQQQATPVYDILAGLCLALARNLKSNLGCGREFLKPIIFTGGVAANAGVVRAIEEVFETGTGELLVPDAHFFTGAIGAVLVAKSKGLKLDLASQSLLEKIDQYMRQQGTSLTNAPRREPLAQPVLPPPRSTVHSELLSQATEPIDAYIGVDVGSLSTNVVVMDTDRRILAKAYLMTAGRPLEAIREGLQQVGKEVAGKVRILGAASTGSGRYLTGDFIGADVVINEITAQATGATIVNPKVDTIFEIGGQDSKYISLNNGVVVDFEMNHACAAGTGSFLEEQAQRLGISIKDEFANLAFASKSPIKLGERCTVFMETDLLSYQQQGASTEDLVAGLSYSIVANYLNRVVGRRRIGDNICFQGGTAFNKGVWAAFEKVLGKPIMVPEHHEVTGALGAAAIAAEYMEKAGQAEQKEKAGQVEKAEQTKQAGQEGQAKREGQVGQKEKARQVEKEERAGQAGQTGQTGLAGKTEQAGRAGQAGQAEQTGQTGLAGKTEQAGRAGQVEQEGQAGRAGQTGQTGLAGKTEQTGRAGEGERRAESKFKGFENLIGTNYTVESFTCEHCANHCEIKRVQIDGSEPLFYGSRCDRYNLKKVGKKKSRFNAFEYRQEKLLEFSGLRQSEDPASPKGLRRAGGGQETEEHRTSNVQRPTTMERTDPSSLKLRRAGYGPFFAKASSYAKATEDEPKGGGQSRTIGIPMALVTWQLLPMFARFFEELGFEVVLSGRTSKETIRKGVESVTAQPCFPVKVAYGHVAELIEKGVDYIFLPSIVSVTANFAENEHNHFCPYVQSFPYQIRTAFGDKLGNTKLLICQLRLGEGDKLVRKTFGRLGKQLNVAQSSIYRAVEKGFEAQQGFERALREKGREILSRIGPDEKLFVLVSRPYNGCDEGVSLQLPKKFTVAGAEMIPMDMLDLERAELSDETLHGEIYWSYGQKILRAGEIIKRDERLFAVYLSNFSCGPDSFLMTFFKDLMGDKPSLQLEIDEHSADAGVITRLEAFLESLKNYRPDIYRGERRDRREKIIKTTSVNSAEKRTLFIPYMSDASYGLAACLRGYGQPAKVMPVADEATLMQGRAYTTGKECLPCAITSGEMLKVLGRGDVQPESAAFFMPGTSGPCRFGLYHRMHELVLRYAGVEEAQVISPNQDSNFYSQLVTSFDGSTKLTTGGTGLGTFMKDMWTAVVGIDLLQKVAMRLRPFAHDPEQARQVYERCLHLWVEAVEQRTADSGQRIAYNIQRIADRNRKRKTDMAGVMGIIADEMATIELDHNTSKPRIGIVGEIYVRNHPFANLNIISRLEELGAACDLASLAEWIYYTNFTRNKMARRRGQLRNLFNNSIQDFFQHRIERKLARPLERRFGRLAEHPVEEVIEFAQPYLDESFEGEAILSIGKIVEYHKQGFGGVVNVMPFTCMPSTIVSTQTRRLSSDCNEMPILNLSFDGQEDATLTTRLEAFVEQVASRQKVKAKELVVK